MMEKLVQLINFSLKKQQRRFSNFFPPRRNQSCFAGSATPNRTLFFLFFDNEDPATEGTRRKKLQRGEKKVALLRLWDREIFRSAWPLQKEVSKHRGGGREKERKKKLLSFRSVSTAKTDISNAIEGGEKGKKCGTWGDLKKCSTRKI